MGGNFHRDLTTAQTTHDAGRDCYSSSVRSAVLCVSFHHASRQQDNLVLSSSSYRKLIVATSSRPWNAVSNAWISYNDQPPTTTVTYLCVEWPNKVINKSGYFIRSQLDSLRCYFQIETSGPHVPVQYSVQLSVDEMK